MESISNPKLQLAYEFVEHTHKNVFLTGKAGTGKTTFLKNLRAHTFKRLIVVAPTGVAAINAGGVTIHSFFQLSFGPQIPLEASGDRQDSGVKKFNKERINIIRSLDLLVIDEISMVRADILDAIDVVLRRFRDRTKPFGGVQLLMIGDIQQLAPVVKDDEWNLLRNYYSSMYFFGSRALNEVSYVSIELDYIFRQSDKIFIDLLNKVRENKVDRETLDILNKRYIPDFNPSDEDGYIILTTHNNTANSLNTEKLEQLKGKSKHFRAAIKDDFPEFIFPTAEELELKVGAQVMFVKNDSSPGKLYYNGKIGIVEKFHEDFIFVKCPTDEDCIAVGKEEWQNMRYSLNDKTGEINETVIGTFIQYPLKLAWAITIHKSQGLTFDKAIIDARSSFAHGQVYVALSRCRTLEGLVLKTPLYDKSIVNDHSILSFSKDISQNHPDEKVLTQSKLQFQLSLVMELFDFKSMLIPFYQCMKLVKEHENSLHVGLMKNLSSLNSSLKNEIEEVAEKFQRQIKSLSITNPDLEKDELIQERIQKAASYFIEKLSIHIHKSLLAMDFDSDNKAIRKSINDVVKNIHKEFQLKENSFKEIIERGFNVQAYVKQRALNAIDTETSKSEKRKRSHKEEEGLYAVIKEWRDAKAEAFDVPEYQVLPKKTIEELVNKLPGTLSDLKKIKGIGAVKVKEFGPELLQMIDKYCKENQIEHQISLEPLKQKIDTKQLSLDMYKAGKGLEEIARERDLSLTTIEGHIAHFIGTGELPIKEFVEEYKIKLITSFYSQFEGSSLSQAKAALTDDIEWGELKMVEKHLEYLKNSTES